MTDKAAAESTTAAQAVFYNLTGEDVTMQVNSQFSTSETIAAIPTVSPYTPNHNSNTYNRVNRDQPQINQFGTTNVLSYSSQTGLGISMTVNIDVDCDDYPTTDPLLIFMYRNAVVVSCPTDSVPYLGHNKETINASHHSRSMTL